MELKRLTMDEIRSLQNEVNALCYDMDKFQEAESQEDNRRYNNHFQHILSGCIQDTITNLYSIIKDTHQGVSEYGSI
jgi:hypothetical protein